MICPGCNTLNFRDYKFCRECGRKLETPSPAQVTQAMQAQSPPDGDEARVQRLLDQAFQAFDADELSEAARACQEALSLRPDSTAGHSLLGLIYERQGQLTDAILQYRIVLDLNPASHADRAKLEALQARTGEAKRDWLGPVRRIRRPALGWGALTLALVFAGVTVMARTRGRTEPVRRPTPVPTVQAALTPSPAVPLPPPAAVLPPPPPQLASPAPAVGAFPRRTLTNAAPPRITQTQVFSAGASARPRLALRPPPTFLPIAPVRGVSGLAASTRQEVGSRPPAASPPVLPQPAASTESQIGAGDAAGTAAAQAPVFAPPAEAAVSPSRTQESPPPDSAISIRRLDDGAAPASAPGNREGRARGRPAPPSLVDARQHLQAGNELRRQGDLDGAYREYQTARELFRVINSHGGAEGVQAAQGYRESNRAMQEIGGDGR